MKEEVTREEARTLGNKNCWQKIRQYEELEAEVEELSLERYRERGGGEEMG